MFANCGMTSLETKSEVSREEAESQQFPIVVHRLQKNIQGCYFQLENELFQYRLTQRL